MKLDLANPDFEPSDEQLQALMKRAFAHLQEQEVNRQEALRERIARGRKELLARLALQETST